MRGLGAKPGVLEHTEQTEWRHCLLLLYSIIFIMYCKVF